MKLGRIVPMTDAHCGLASNGSGPCRQRNASVIDAGNVAPVWPVAKSPATLVRLGNPTGAVVSEPLTAGRRRSRWRPLGTS